MDRKRMSHDRKRGNPVIGLFIPVYFVFFPAIAALHREYMFFFEEICYNNFIIANRFFKLDRIILTLWLARI